MPVRKKSKTKRVLDLLRAFESPNVLHIEPDGSWPIVWERAQGTRVWDAEGRSYLDLTAAFGVAAAGHANPRVVAAGRRQLGLLAHAMGDVHPHAPKAALARELSRLTFERWTGGRFTGKTIFNNSGFEAVEAALKTALLASGRRGIVAFTGGYHGLGYGALNATHRPFFRAPFQSQLGRFGRFAPFPRSEADLPPLRARLKTLMGGQSIGALVVEPIQARSAARFFAALAPVVRPTWRLARAGRDLHRLWPDGKMVRLRGERDPAGCHLPGQGAHGRIPALGLRRARGYY
jgi:4-aminobutyrate aminotransferase-like enzyme